MVRETRHLWVGNLPHTIREERILDHFKRYGKVQSVKILPKKEDDSGGACATVAFIDIKSAAKAHNADNKIEDRTLKTDYYEPPASSTASSAIYIHERDDALVRNPAAPYSTPRTPRYGLSEERNYERPGHYYNDRESYLRRPLGMGYHDEDNYQGRAKSRDRYSRSNSGTTYTEGTERNQNHFRSHNTRQHFEQPRYPVGEQYNDEREPAGTTPRLNRRTNNSAATPVVASVASPTPTRSESRPRRTKRRSPSRTPSGSRSNSGSRSRSRSSSGSRSSSSSSKLRSTSSDSSGRSRSPSKSRSPAASYGSQSNTKGSRLDRPSSAIANPSSTVCYLPSAVNTSAINCTSNNTQGSTPTQGCPLDSLQNNCDKEEKRPLGICVRNLPVRSTDTSLKDGLFHEYKKHGKVTMVKVIGQGTDRYAVVCFKKPEDVDKALEVSKDKLFFGCKIEVTAHEGLDAEDNEFRPLEAELDEFHPKATRTLFIGNLEKDITTAELRKHFEQFGEIIEIDIKKQGSATSYAFIQYSDIASVVKAMRKLDGENLGANRIKLGFGKSMPTNCVWLDGIVDSVSDKFLARHFSRFGIVAYTAVDREKGHALVFYESVEFAQIAVSEMRGRILQGKKLQVDFASRECQQSFFDKLEMTGQMLPGDGTRPWERRERRGGGGPEFEVVRNDDRETRVGFENRAYQRYEGTPRANRGNFRGNQRTGFPGRGRGQNFSGRYEVYHDEFGERRHRYNSRDESGNEATLFDGKIERIKYTDTPDCPTRKRNKLRNSISDQESHHSQSPPRSRHQSRSTSPVSKERKSLKDRLHHRIKSPGSHNSSLVNSPCRDTILDELETNSEYRDSRLKSSDIKIDDLMADLSYTSPRSSSEKEGSEKMLSKSECDSFRSRSSLDAESADESGINSDQLGQIERKKRLLATSVKGGKDSKTSSEKTKPKNSIKLSKLNCLSEATVEELKSELESVNVQYECAKEKSQNSDCANSEMKYLKKKQVQILHLLDQLHESVNSSDNDCSMDGERLSRKKHRSSSCIETNSICESDISKSHTKDECGSKGCKSGMKDPAILAKLKKSDSVDSNCISLSLDSFIFRKHLDPRKGFDQHSVSLATVNSLQKCRRISVDNDTCLPNSHGTSESFLCVPSSIATDVAWKKHGNSLSDVNFSENETDSSITLSHFKIKEENLDEDILNKKSHLSNSHSIDLPKSLLSLRTFSDGLPCHEIKRERDISPLSLPLPKFAASLRSPKSSPSILTSPKSTSAHSPRAGHSPSYSCSKSIRIPDLLHDIPIEKKNKDIVPEEKTNGANISPMDSGSLFEPQINDTSESIPSVEPIQSPKCNYDKIKECISSSESEFSPSSSPNRPSIEDRIKALDEKFNAWSGSTRTVSATIADVTPVPDLTPKCTVKRSRFSYLTETRKEPSEIVKSLLAHSTIFDQDSKRLQHIDEKYEPLNIKMDLSPKVKPTFRTKAAAKEFSTPIASTIQNLNQSLLIKTPASVMVAQGIISPPATPQSVTSSILSPVTPPVSQYTQLTSSVFTPCSPHSTSFSIPSTVLKNADSLTSPLEKDISDQLLKSPQVFNTMKVKVDPDFHANSAVLATSLKSSPLMCPSETPSHGSVVTSLSLKKEPASPTEAVTENVCNEISTKVSVKKEVINSMNIPPKKESSIVLMTKDHSHYNSIDQDKKEFCDSKDPRLSFSDEVGHWRESSCKDEMKTCTDSSAKSYTCSDVTENASVPAGKKRVSSVDSNESDSSKSINPVDISLKLPHESSRECHESNWPKQEKLSEPEPKKPKMSKNVRDRSLSPPLHQTSKKCDKKEKSLKTEKSKSTTKSVSTNNPEKSRQEMKCNNRSDYKDKSKSEHKSSKEEKRSKSRESKDSSNKNETRSKPRERRNSEKDNKNSSSSKSSIKPKKESSSKNEKSGEKKQSEKKSSRSKSNEFDWSAWMLDDEPVYFSMYDKVKARSSKSQTLKHQTTSDLESVRQKFSKLKQSRAKREEKSKSIDQDSDKDSDSSHHSSESESEAKPAKMRQQRKRKLVIESSSEDDASRREVNSHPTKIEKHFQSDSATDSDFDYNVSHRQTTNKTRKKKTELLDSDSSDSDSNFPLKSQTGRKKSASNRSKGRVEKSKKVIKSGDDISDLDMSKNQKSKEKEKSKKIKKEVKVELEIMECDAPKKSDDGKNIKKKTKDSKSESDLSPVQKKFKSEHSSKDKSSQAKDKKTDSCNEKVQSSEETEKHKPYSKKRKKSKKMSRNKDKRNSEKNSQDRKQPDESDTKSSLPVLLSPKPSSPLPDKQLSPPCLQAGIMSDNDFKSDFSDFDFDNAQNEEVDTSRDMWKHLDTKSDSNSEKSSKNKKENSSKSETIIHSPEQDSSLPSFFDKLSDITDSETGREITDFASDIPPEASKQMSFSSRKDKDFSGISPHKIKHEKHEDQGSSKQENGKYCNMYSSPSKEERRRKKSKKQCKERKKKSKDETHVEKDIIDSAPSPKPSIFESAAGDEDSRLSDIRLDEDIAEEARRLEQELLAASEETSTFGDDGPAKREEKLLERRFEEEAAKETRRLEAELLSTGRDSWHMKEKEYDSVPNSGDLCDDKLTSELDTITGKEENIFVGLELHSSVGETSQNDADVFLSGHSESDPYKIDDKDVTNEIEDQRKIEDDLAVSALLQEMHCGEISAPELTKEADYLDMEAHPDETMNYLLPDDGENSLHIADSSPDGQGNDSQDPKLESDVLSPSSNSEPPPALEISTVEDSLVIKTANDNQVSENLKIDSSVNQIQNKASCYEFNEESSLEMCESKPPVIDLPVIQGNVETLVTPVSPKPELVSLSKKKQNDKPFRVPPKPDAACNEETDDECSSDLTENQLAHFEDITNDTADSKDDDNPPVLLPVESPPNLLPVSDTKDQMEPLDKVAMDDNQCLDRIIGKAPSAGDGIFTDLDKQIGDIINSITEFKKQSYENEGFQMPGTHDMSNLPEHSITDPLGLNSSSNIFDHSKPEEPVESQDFDPAEILKPSEKQVSNTHQSSLSVSYADECSSSNNNNKFELPQISTSCIIEPSILNYSGILNSNCEANVIQTTQKMDNDAVTISITEKSNTPNVEQFEENRDMNVSDGNHTSSDSFLLELFGPKSDENFKIQTSASSDKDKTKMDVDNHSQEKSEQPETDLSPHTFGLQHEIKPLFEIPEINEQNEATEFNQEIFETPSDSAKESQIPCLLSFSFSESSSKKTDKIDDNHPVNTDSSMLENEKTSESPSNNEIDGVASCMPVQPESNRDVEPLVDDKKPEDFKEENLNIEESLERKARPADAESVCSDTTDITIPETKVEIENNQVTSSEEQIHEEICPVEEIKINIKPKIERPRRGRRPKTRRYMESAAQKQETSSGSPSKPVNMRVTRRGGGRLTTERTRRSLRSDTSELHNESNETKQVSVEEIVLSEPEDSKKDDDITELSGTVTTIKAENLGAHSAPELKLTDKPTKIEEPRKRRGRRKKNSGDHSTQLSDKTDNKSNEHEPSKNFNRSKETRLILSLSEREQNSAKENSTNMIDVYDFTDEDIEDVKFESVKERLHESNRASTSAIDSSKHDKKSFVSDKKEKILEEPKSKPGFEKKEKVSDEPKNKSVLEKKEKVVEEIKSKPVPERKEKVVEETKSKPVPEKKEKIFEETKTKPGPSEEREPVLKEHHAKISLTIRLQKDGPDGAVGTAEIIKKSEDLNVREESKRESSKPERNTASKHDTAETYNGPCKSTRKSTRLMNQAASRSSTYEVSDEVVKKNSKSSNSSIAFHSEPVPTRVTRKLRSSRRSEENLPLPSESSEDVSEDRNKNEPVFFIHDNAVKEVLPEPKKSKANHATESASISDTSAAPESHKKNDTTSLLRLVRILRSSNSDSSKESSHGLSTSSSDQEGPKKETVSTSEEQFDALKKDSRKSKVLKVEVARIAVKDLKKTEKLTETEEDSDSRSGSAILLDPETGVLSSVSKSSESSETPNTTNNPEIKTASNTAHDTPNIAPSKTIKTSTNETLSTATVIHESSKINPPVETPVSARAPLVQSLRSRKAHPVVAVQSSVTPAVCDSSSKLPANEKPVENVKKPTKKTCSAVPVLAMAANPAISAESTLSLVPESKSGTSSLNVSITQSHPATITSLGIPITATGTQSLNEVKKEDVLIPVVPKISHATRGYQPSVRAIVTAVVTQITAGPSTSLASNVQTKCSNPVSTSSVLIGPELPAVYSFANIPPTTVSEHIASISKPVSLPAPMTSEPSNIPHAKETHIFSSSPITPVTTRISSKVSSSRNTETHPHVCTIQTSSTSIPVFTTKSESRSSKVTHITNSTPSYPQQSAFSVSPGYEAPRSNAHIAVGNSSGMMTGLLQNSHLLQQQQHKEYFAIGSGQLQSQGVRPATPIASSIPLEIAARLPHTPPHTPTPPVTSSNHALPPSELHLSHVNPSFLRHQTQSTIMTVPPHPSLGMHNTDINAFVHHMYSGAAALNPYGTPIHSDIRVQQEAQTRAAVIGRFAFPSPIPGNVPPNNFRQPAESRHQQSGMDTKSEQKPIHVLESRPEEKLHSVKPGRSKRDDKDIKISSSDREDHDKISITHRTQQHYSSARQSSPCLTVSHDRTTDSPIIANPYASGQGRGSQVDTAQPPIAHQTMPSTLPYLSLDTAAHSASRQMLSVLQLGSPATNPAHSPNSHIFKKDSGHSQQIPSHNPASDKRVSSEQSKKVHTKMSGHQGSSISPGPSGMPPARSPLTNTMHLSHNTQQAMSPHFLMASNDPQPCRRVNSHIPQLDPSLVYPPPAHGMSQQPSSNVPRTLTQTPANANQVNDGAILQRYPVMWQGLLALKNDQAAVQMHFVSGNHIVAQESLPKVISGEAASIRISQRMRLDPQQLEGVQRKIQQTEEHCILMALPCGKDHSDLVRQSDNLKNGFINYLFSKHAAGIVNAAAPGSSGQPAFVIHIFPSCPFILSNLSRITPELLHLVNDISHLVIIIATV